MPSRDQGELFALTEVKPVNEGETKSPIPAGIDVAVAGVAMSQLFRAQEFGLAMKEMNAANSGSGMQAASGTELHRPDLESRYDDHLSDVLKGSLTLGAKRVKNARQNIVNLAMPQALIRAGFSEKEVWNMSKAMENKMLSIYGVGVANADIRNKAAKAMRKTAQKAREGKQQRAS